MMTKFSTPRVRQYSVVATTLEYFQEPNTGLTLHPVFPLTNTLSVDPI
jgi:hypothetical protein